MKKSHSLAARGVAFAFVVSAGAVMVSSNTGTQPSLTSTKPQGLLGEGQEVFNFNLSGVKFDEWLYA